MAHKWILIALVLSACTSRVGSYRQNYSVMCNKGCQVHFSVTYPTWYQRAWTLGFRLDGTVYATYTESNPERKP